MGIFIISIFLNEIQLDGDLIVIKVGGKETEEVLDIFEIKDFDISEITENITKITILGYDEKIFEYIFTTENLKNIIEYDNKIMIPIQEDGQYLHIEIY